MNNFYKYLNNRTAEDSAAYVGGDYVPDDFEPVSRHTIIESMATALFGEGSASQYWITRARQTIRNSPLEGYVSLPHREGGYRIDDLAASLEAVMRPQLSDGTSPEYFGKYRLDNYLLSEFYITRENDDMIVSPYGGPEIARAELINGSARVTIFPQMEAGVVIPSTAEKHWLIWASRPSLTVAKRMQLSSPTGVSPVAATVPGLPSIFDSETLDRLVSLLDLSLQQQIAFGAAALLIAGHTAAVAGETF